MKILSIQQYNFTNTYTPKISFKGGTGDEYIHRETLYKDNHNAAYNTEYQPLEREKIIPIKGKPLILPSERMFRHNKNSLRENELFYDDIDSSDYVSTKYDENDVALDSSLLVKPYNSAIQNYAPDTLMADGFLIYYDSIRAPWISKNMRIPEEKIEKYKNRLYMALRTEENISYTDMKNIFKSSSLITNGKEQLNIDLCNLAVKIYKNSKTWDETEKAIMDEIRIPIYKKVYGNYSTKKYEFVNKCLDNGYLNEGILDFLQEFYPGYVLDLSSIMTKKEVDKYNSDK